MRRPYYRAPYKSPLSTTTAYQTARYKNTPQKYSTKILSKNLLTKKIPSAIVTVNFIPRRTAMTQFNNANKTDGLVLLHITN